MKIEIKAHQLFKAIKREMDNCEEAFAEKPEVLAAKTLFGSNNDKIGVHLSQLLRPVATVRFPRQDSVSRMRKTFTQMIGIGLILATSQNNQPLIEMLHNYYLQRRRCTAYQLYEFATHVLEELTKMQELAADNGLTAVKLAALTLTVKEYGETLENTGFQLSDRRKSWLELKNLIKENRRLLRLQLDPFVRYIEDEYPEFFNNYTFLRKRKPSKASTEIPEELVEIAGTVTDSITGLPVANATINIVDFGMIATTDADGCYILDELEAGAYVVNCFANNYQVPEAVTFTAEAGESLVVDFSLTPVAPEAPATE